MRGRGPTESNAVAEVALFCCLPSLSPKNRAEKQHRRKMIRKRKRRNEER